MRKPVFRVSDLVKHKSGCITTNSKKIKFQIKEVGGLYNLCSNEKIDNKRT